MNLMLFIVMSHISLFVAYTGGLQFFVNVSIGSPPQPLTLLLSTTLASSFVFCPPQPHINAPSGWQDTWRVVIERLILGLTAMLILLFLCPRILQNVNVTGSPRKVPSAVDDLTHEL